MASTPRRRLTRRPQPERAAAETLERLEQQRAAELAVRRALHEEVQALKGAVRVYCRLRAPLAPSAPAAPRM